MCSYCGCRAIAVIGRLSNEHVAIINATGAPRRTASAGDAEAQARAVQLLAGLLGPEFADHIDVLCNEHREIDAYLARVRNGDFLGVEALETLLRRHIDKEENGMFPAATIAPDGAARDRIALLSR